MVDWIRWGLSDFGVESQRPVQYELDMKILKSTPVFAEQAR